jgi:hypothetical protein
MKKFFLPFLAMTLFVIPVMAQNTFNKGDRVVNLSVGFGSGLYSGSAYSNVTPAIAGSYEYGVKDELFDANSSLGVGAYLGYTGSKYTYGPGYGWKYSDIIIGARGAVHYQFIDHLDTYAGLMLGYDIVSSKTFGTGVFSGNATSSGFKFDVFVGGRYYFTDKFAGLVELGSGISYVNIGVAIKL